jgi:hypothetical protein
MQEEVKTHGCVSVLFVFIRVNSWLKMILFYLVNFVFFVVKKISEISVISV